MAPPQQCIIASVHGGVLWGSWGSWGVLHYNHHFTFALFVQIYLTGGLTALVQFASNVTGGEAKVCKTKLHKVRSGDWWTGAF